MFSALYNTLFFKPILNFVIVIYNFLPAGLQNMGTVIVIVLIVIRVLLIPLTKSDTRNRKLLKKLQDSGKIKELDQHKKDPQLYMQKMKELYAKYELSPLKGTFLSLLIQLPLFFALYRVFRMIMTGGDFASYLYNGVSAPENFNIVLFSVINLAEANVIFAIILAVTQYLFMAYGPTAIKKKQVNLKDNNSEHKDKQDKQELSQEINQNMGQMFKWVLPVLMFMIGVSLPSGISLYIILSLLINWLILAYLDKKVEKDIQSKYTFETEE